MGTHAANHPSAHTHMHARGSGDQIQTGYLSVVLIKINWLRPCPVYISPPQHRAWIHFQALVFTMDIMSIGFSCKTFNPVGAAIKWSRVSETLKSKKTQQTQHCTHTKHTKMWKNYRGRTTKTTTDSLTQSEMPPLRWLPSCSICPAHGKNGATFEDSVKVFQTISFKIHARMSTTTVGKKEMKEFNQRGRQDVRSCPSEPPERSGWSKRSIDQFVLRPSCWTEKQHST